MFARSIRITPTRVLLGFTVLAIVTVAAYAAAPAFTPAEGNAPKPQAGQAAPTFSLVDQNGKKHQLADYKGKWVVVYFYPKDNTPGCTLEAQDFRDRHKAFAKAGTAVVGVSRDSVKSHEGFCAKQNLPFTLLSDPDHAVAEKYGVWVEKSMYGRKYMGIERSTFVIDPEGKLKAEFRKVKVDGHVDEVLAAAKA